jgi:S1-C subfamily serine protease
VTVASTQLAAPPIAAALPQSGSVAFAAAPGVPPIVAPIFIAGVSGDTIIVTNPLDPFVGMPVFLNTGELAGIVAAGRGGLRVLSIAAAQRPPSGDTPYLGLSLQLGPGVADETRPVVVSAVAADGIGHAADLREGDVLLDIDGTPPADIDAAVSSLRQAAAGDVPVPLRVRRGRRVVRLTLPTRPAP